MLNIFMFIFIFKILYQTPLVSFLTYNLLCSLKQNYLEQHHLTPLLIRGGGKKNNKRTNKQKISSLTLFNISPVSVMSLSQRRSLVGLKFPFHCTCAFEMERGFLRPSLTSWFRNLLSETVILSLEICWGITYPLKLCKVRRDAQKIGVKQEECCFY